MQAVLNQLGVIGLALWGAVLLVTLLGLFFWLRLERRSFSKQGKTGSWLWMRIWYLPILMLTIAAVILPINGISGMEALGYFYIALFTLGPLVWFGLHLLVGKYLKPAFTRSESLILALSGLGFIIMPVIVLSAFQSPIFLIMHKLGQYQTNSSVQAPLPFFVQDSRHFELGGQALFTQALIASPDIKINRIDVLMGGQWHDSNTHMRNYYCRNGQDIHLAWFSGAPAKPLKFYWQNAAGERFQSEYMAPAGMNATAAIPFDIQWREDGFDLPVPLQRSVVQLSWLSSDRDDFMELNPLQPGEDFINDCVMRGYQRVNWQSEGSVMRVQLRMFGHTMESNLRHVIAR